jgi:energy-coupling factor transporter ATP-binding protein EcfA2
MSSIKKHKPSHKETKKSYSSHPQTQKGSFKKSHSSNSKHQSTHTKSHGNINALKQQHKDNYEKSYKSSRAKKSSRPKASRVEGGSGPKTSRVEGGSRNKNIEHIAQAVRKFKPVDKVTKAEIKHKFDIDSEDYIENTKEVVYDGKTLRLKKFHPKMLMQIAKNPTVAMIAKRGSGKSTAIRAIMDYYKDIPGGNIISKTEKMSPFFSCFFPDLFIFYDYTTEIVQNLLDRQEDIKDKRFRKERKKKNPSTVDTRAWLIMDDCLAQKGKWAKDGPILEVFLNGRHYDLFFVLTMQYPLGIGPDLRSNFDFIFIFFSNYINIQRKIWEQYAGMFDTFDSFKFVFNKCTTNYGCMVINNRINSENVEDIVYWWRAEDKELTDFIGHKSFVAHHNKFYDKHYLRKLRLAKKQKRFNIVDACRKKRNSCDFKVSLVNN